RRGKVRTLLEDAIDVDGKEGKILPERPQTNPAVRIDVLLADLDEAAVRSKQAEAQRHRLAGERIEDQIYAASVRPGPDVVDEPKRVGIGQVPNAHRAEKVTLLRTARRGVDLGADLLGNLDGGESDAPGGGVNQHPFALPQPSEVVQRIVRRGEG